MQETINAKAQKTTAAVQNIGECEESTIHQGAARQEPKPYSCYLQWTLNKRLFLTIVRLHYVGPGIVIGHWRFSCYLVNKKHIKHL